MTHLKHHTTLLSALGILLACAPATAAPPSLSVEVKGDLLDDPFTMTGELDEKGNQHGELTMDHPKLGGLPFQATTHPSNRHKVDLTHPDHAFFLDCSEPVLTTVKQGAHPLLCEGFFVGELESFPVSVFFEKGKAQDQTEDGEAPAPESTLAELASELADYESGAVRLPIDGPDHCNPLDIPLLAQQALDVCCDDIEAEAPDGAIVNCNDNYVESMTLDVDCNVVDATCATLSDIDDGYTGLAVTYPDGLETSGTTVYISDSGQVIAGSFDEIPGFDGFGQVWIIGGDTVWVPWEDPELERILEGLEQVGEALREGIEDTLEQALNDDEYEEQALEDCLKCLADAHEDYDCCVECCESAPGVEAPDWCFDECYLETEHGVL